MAGKPQISPKAKDAITARIKTSALVEKLQTFALASADQDVATGITSYYDAGTGKRIPTMTPAQVAATKMLLDKVLPNLTAIEATSDETKTFVLRAPAPEADAMEWLQKYGPKTIDHIPSPKEPKA